MNTRVARVPRHTVQGASPKGNAPAPLVPGRRDLHPGAGIREKPIRGLPNERGSWVKRPRQLIGERKVDCGGVNDCFSKNGEAQRSAARAPSLPIDDRGSVDMGVRRSATVSRFVPYRFAEVKRVAMRSFRSEEAPSRSASSRVPPGRQEGGVLPPATYSSLARKRRSGGRACDGASRHRPRAREEGARPRAATPRGRAKLTISMFLAAILVGMVERLRRESVIR
jgi:hypothetical protein